MSTLKTQGPGRCQRKSPIEDVMTGLLRVIAVVFEEDTYGCR